MKAVRHPVNVLAGVGERGRTELQLDRDRIWKHDRLRQLQQDRDEHLSVSCGCLYLWPTNTRIVNTSFSKLFLRKDNFFHA